MKRYKIELRGENFLLNLDGEPQKFGFTLCRCLQALDEATAEKAAIIMARQLPVLQNNLCSSINDIPRILLTHICQVNRLWFAFAARRQHFELHAEETQD